MLTMLLMLKLSFSETNHENVVFSTGNTKRPRLFEDTFSGSKGTGVEGSKDILPRELCIY